MAREEWVTSRQDRYKRPVTSKRFPKFIVHTNNNLGNFLEYKFCFNRYEAEPLRFYIFNKMPVDNNTMGLRNTFGVVRLNTFKFRLFPHNEWRDILWLL